MPLGELGSERPSRVILAGSSAGRRPGRTGDRRPRGRRPCGAVVLLRLAVRVARGTSRGPGGGSKKPNGFEARTRRVARHHRPVPPAGDVVDCRTRTTDTHVGVPIGRSAVSRRPRTGVVLATGTGEGASSGSASPRGRESPERVTINLGATGRPGRRDREGRETKRGARACSRPGYPGRWQLCSRPSAARGAPVVVLPSPPLGAAAGATDHPGPA